MEIQAQAGPVTVDALETILARATVPILQQLDERPRELVVALLPSLVRTMLAAFVEVMAGGRGGDEGPGRGARRWRPLKLPTLLFSAAYASPEVMATR